MRLEAGHFALESQGPEIAAIIRDFLARKLTQKSRTSWIYTGYPVLN
jgi:hypothetical protein